MVLSGTWGWPLVQIGSLTKKLDKLNIQTRNNEYIPHESQPVSPASSSPLRGSASGLCPSSWPKRCPRLTATPSYLRSTRAQQNLQSSVPLSRPPAQRVDASENRAQSTLLSSNIHICIHLSPATFPCPGLQTSRAIPLACAGQTAPGLSIRLESN